MEGTADPSWVKWHLCLEVYVFVPMCLCVWEEERVVEAVGTVWSAFISSAFPWNFSQFVIFPEATSEGKGNKSGIICCVQSRDGYFHLYLCAAPQWCRDWIF